MKTEDFVILRDSREQRGHGWNFGRKDGFNSTKVQCLKTGDYTIEGYEDILCIERKGSIVEIAGNVTQKRFENELERMCSIEHSFIICEFDFYELMTFPNSAKVAWSVKKSFKITPTFIMKRINEFQLNYPAKWLFTGAYGQQVANSIIKRIIEKYEPAQK